MNGRNSTAARVLAPLAFLLAVTVLVLLVRSALDPGEQVAATDSAPTETQPAAPPQTQTEEEGPATVPPAETAAPPADATYYEIQSGDTLESIADQHGTTVERLLELNPGIDPVALTVGQRVRIT